MSNPLQVAIAGIGFIGQVHIRSVRAAGGHIAGVSGGNPERTRAIADSLGIETVYASSEELVSDPNVDVVHICTPNASHAPLALKALRNGKHVICEKPLATDAATAIEAAEAALAAGLVATVPFVYRFHPMVREARGRVSNGDVGALRLIHGSYQQDWLASPDDYSWRVDPKQGGTSQAFADIGSHWCDLIEFVTGHRITRLSAKTLTTVAERAVGEVTAFAKNESFGKRVPVHGDDAITMMFETDKDAAGTVLISQVSWGRKNRLWFELDGANKSVVFDQENPEQLWLGGRASSSTLSRDPGTLLAEAAKYATLPAGHAQGYADAFDAFVADTYAAIRGEEPDGLPTFEAGRRAAMITQTVLDSAADETWKEVPQ